MLRIATFAALSLLPNAVAHAQNIQNCGSYQQNGPILSGTCLGNYGIPQRTSIDLRSCPMYAIRNQSGSFVCSGGGRGYGGGYGGGGYGGGYGGGGYGRPRYGY